MQQQQLLPLILVLPVQTLPVELKFLGTEYGKTISLKRAIVNGTPGSQAVIKGNAVLNGVNITINGKVILKVMVFGWLGTAMTGWQHILS